MKKHRVPEQDVPFPGEKLFLFELSGLRRNPIVITLGRRWRARMQVRLRIIVEFRKPFRSMGTGTVNQRAAVRCNIFAGDPASEQKPARPYMEDRHVLMQALAASARKRDAGTGNRAALEDQRGEPEEFGVSKYPLYAAAPAVQPMNPPGRFGQYSYPVFQ